MNPSPKPKTVIALKVQEKAACCSSCAEAVTPSLPSSSEALPENVLLARYRIEKLCCATEERLIRNRVDGMHGIVRLDFNLLERELTVVHRLGDPQTITAALDSLDMVGTLGAGGKMVALVMDPERVVHKVVAGQYMGQSDGRIEAISENRIDLTELVPDGAGGWMERKAQVALDDE